MTEKLNLAEVVESQRERFMAVANDKHVNFDREAQFAIQILQNNEYVAQTAAGNVTSLKNAINNVAALGITLNPAQKFAYLVPRKIKGYAAICLDISYMGLLNAAVESGSIKWGQARVVYQNDTFELQGVDKQPVHVYDPFDKDRGKILGAYVVVKTDTGDYLTHSMKIDDIYEIRDMSEMWKKKQSGPWKDFEEEMIKKTVVKQAYKYWPRRKRLDDAIHFLNTEAGEGINFEKDVTPLDDVKTGNPPLLDSPMATLSEEKQNQAMEVADRIGNLFDEGFEWKALDEYQNNVSLKFREAVWKSLGERKHSIGNGKFKLCRTALTALKKAEDNGDRPEDSDGVVE